MTKLQGSLVSEFQYAGYYMHAPSSLNLTVHRAYDSAFGRWINRDPIEELGGIDLYAYVHNEPVDHQDPSGLFQWYGNWGGPNWVNGGPGSELGPFPWNPSQRGFHKPWDPRDRCYYWHDICLHNAGISKNKTQRRCDRRNCDVALSQCLQYVKDTYPNQFGGITPGEIGNFGSPGSFNDNPGEAPNPNNPQKPYPVNYDPGVINPGVPKQ